MYVCKSTKSAAKIHMCINTNTYFVLYVQIQVLLNLHVGMYVYVHSRISLNLAFRLEFKKSRFLLNVALY